MEKSTNGKMDTFLSLHKATNPKMKEEKVEIVKRLKEEFHNI